MGPIQKADSRHLVVSRMLALRSQRCDLVLYPELALTTFFPRWYMTDASEIDAWFEREIAPCSRSIRHRALVRLCAHARRSPFQYMHPGDRDGRIVGKYRKVHLPGHSEYDPQRAFQHLEKRYF